MSAIDANGVVPIEARAALTEGRKTFSIELCPCPSPRRCRGRCAPAHRIDQDYLGPLGGDGRSEVWNLILGARGKLRDAPSEPALWCARRVIVVDQVLDPWCDRGRLEAPFLHQRDLRREG